MTDLLSAKNAGAIVLGEIAMEMDSVCVLCNIVRPHQEVFECDDCKLQCNFILRYNTFNFKFMIRIIRYFLSANFEINFR